MGGDGDDEGPRLVVNGSVLEEVEQFCWTLKQEWREQWERE